MFFNEKHHAFISACFYKELIEHYPKNGEAIFTIATQRYGEQRGSRMAQRAIRDGRRLDFATYCAYGEWSYTEKHFLESRHMKVITKSPDYHYYVFDCPWHKVYADMGLIDGACIYCSHIDLSIARGFNPYLIFEVRSTLHKEGRCEFVLKDAYLEEKEYATEKGINKMPFQYHCGHIYKTFTDIVRSILGEKGQYINEKVVESFSNSFGENMGQVLLAYANTDFNIIP